MKERRNKNLASLAKFLQDPKRYSRNKESSEYVSYCSKEQVYTEATKLLARLYGQNENNVDDATTPTLNSCLDGTEGPVDFRMMLQAAISDACKEPILEEPKLSGASVKRDFKLFELHQQKTQNIIRLQNISKSVRQPPLSRKELFQ